ncbi:manganese ion binding protein [Aureococcus anophagefferens]|nr:manganese ion binding protein [Aureococcus anophagefferens]
MVASPSAAAWTARSGGVTSLDDCGGGVAVGTATLQGWRDAQEDAHVVDAQSDGALLLGLFDGHGGAAAAAMAARELGGCAAGATNGAALALLLRVDGAPARRGARRLRRGRPHAPCDAGERARIEALGGVVLRNRVNGRLGVARALGDFDFKADAADGCLVSPAADFVDIPREAGHEFLVLACDGLWDVFAPDQAARFVEAAWGRGARSPDDVARRLAHGALLRGSKDNISVVLVMLDGPGLAARLERDAARRDLPVDAPTFDDAAFGEAPAPAPGPCPAFPATPGSRGDLRRAQTPQRPCLSPAAPLASAALFADDGAAIGARRSRPSATRASPRSSAAWAWATTRRPSPASTAARSSRWTAPSSGAAASTTRTRSTSAARSTSGWTRF